MHSKSTRSKIILYGSFFYLNMGFQTFLLVLMAHGCISAKSKEAVDLNIDDMLGRLQRLEEKVAIQDAIIGAQNKEIRKTQRELVVQQDMNKKLKADIDGIYKNVQEKCELLKNVGEKEVRHTARNGRQAGEHVAFFATFVGSWVHHVSPNQPIVFPDVDLNIGNAYHASTGLFIAPISGVYIFSVTMFVNDWAGQKWIDVRLFVNGMHKEGVVATGRAQGTQMIIVNLKANDEVFVKERLPEDADFWGDRLSSFSGILVIPL